MLPVTFGTIKFWFEVLKIAVFGDLIGTISNSDFYGLLRIRNPIELL
jgi:hypothetical protein